MDNMSYIELFRESARQVFNDPNRGPRPPRDPLIQGNTHTHNHERNYNNGPSSDDPLDRVEVIAETPYS